MVNPPERALRKPKHGFKDPTPDTSHVIDTTRFDDGDRSVWNQTCVRHSADPDRPQRFTGAGSSAGAMHHTRYAGLLIPGFRKRWASCWDLSDRVVTAIFKW